MESRQGADELVTIDQWEGSGDPDRDVEENLQKQTRQSVTYEKEEEIDLIR